MSKKKLPSTSDTTPDVTVTTNVTNPVPAAVVPLVSQPVTPVVPSRVVTTTTTSTVPSPNVEKSIFKSKKFFYGSLAMSLASAIYFMNVILVTKYPGVAPAYLSLFNTMISFIAGITSGILGIHSFMDYATSATNAIQNTATTAISAATNITKTYNFTEPQKTENVEASRTKLPAGS